MATEDTRHLRREIERHADPLRVLESFLRQHGDTARPGPAPRTMAEHMVCLDQSARIAERATNRSSSAPATSTHPTAGPH